MQRFKNILCIIQPGSDNQIALQRAVSLATNNQAQLSVVQVIDKIPAVGLKHTPISAEQLYQTVIKQHLTELLAIVRPWMQHLDIQTKVLCGTAFLQTTREVLVYGHDLVVKVADNGGLIDRVFGSEDMHLLRKCPCPVWLLKPKLYQAPYQQILAAIDVPNIEDFTADEITVRTELNLRILKMASSLASMENARLDIINVWTPIGESVMRSPFLATSEKDIMAYIEESRQQQQQNLEQLIYRLIQAIGPKPWSSLHAKTHLIKGNPREKIPMLAKQINADLVVMGTVARTGVAGFFMGNTAETILNKLNCSVLAIKPAGFKSPIQLEN